MAVQTPGRAEGKEAMEVLSTFLAWKTTEFFAPNLFWSLSELLENLLS